jgi:hypothetical protein
LAGGERGTGRGANGALAGARTGHWLGRERGAEGAWRGDGGTVRKKKKFLCNR